MSSINTNISAMTALQSLTAANKAYTETQKHIATGLRVGEASDNAAYWSIATTMRSDRSALSTVQDALGLGGSMVDVAYTAVNTSIDLVDQIKTKLVAAREPGIDRTKVQSEISELQKQLAGIASSASFSGDNWLSVDSSVSTYNASKNIVASFVRTGNTVSVQTITIDSSGMDLFDANGSHQRCGRHTRRQPAPGRARQRRHFSVSGLSISALTDSSTDLATLDSYIKGADAAIREMTTAAGSLGASRSASACRRTSSPTHQRLDRGIGSLVDADMNEESTKLQALQVKQQLGIQALSIANAQSQNILRLFQ
jgi:flagellin